MSDEKKKVVEEASGIHVDHANVVDTALGPVIIATGHTAEACPNAAARAEVDRKGPSKVVSDAYRDGFDRIFGNRKTTYEA